MANKIDKANKHLKENLANNTFKPKFHFAPPVGWANDPNGLCQHNGVYHLFYQHNPYSSKWGRMYWGHATSSDLVNWMHQPVALAPSNRNDNFLGCYSGSAISRGEELFLMYTGVGYFKQQQILARSHDGIVFEKEPVPVITSNNRPPNSSKFEFRDPKIFETNGRYYSVIGASYFGGKQIALYQSENLIDWKYVGSPIVDKLSAKGIFECPDLLQFADNDVLIYSVMNTETVGNKFQNLHSSCYQIGKLDLASGEFDSITEIKELDCGADYYAPQTFIDDRGRRIIIAWMQMWWRTMPTSLEKHNWAGMMTLPKEIYLDKGILCQKPVEEIYKHFDRNYIKVTEELDDKKRNIEGISGRQYLLEVELNYSDDIEISLRGNDYNETVISYAGGTLKFDREFSGHIIKGRNLDGNPNIRVCDIAPIEKLNIQIFVDTSSVEIIVNERYHITSTIYPFAELDSSEIKFNSTLGARVDISFSPLKK